MLSCQLTQNQHKKGHATMKYIPSFSDIKAMAKAHGCYTLDDEDFRFAANMALKGTDVNPDLLIKWHYGALEEQGGDCLESRANEECYR
jgi:hypothetical protein